MPSSDKTKPAAVRVVRMAATISDQARDDGPELKTIQSGYPRHPITHLQRPFEESIVESSNPPDTKELEAFIALRSKQRWQTLLDNKTINVTYNSQWRAQPGSKFHPLTKILAQISFGVHLLHRQLARSDQEVLRIVQKHVDDMDNFVQRAEEDLGLAIADVNGRINYLKLPLEHASVFDVMLEDRSFRSSVLSGNENLDFVVDATSSYNRDLQADIRKATEATFSLKQYLENITDDWPSHAQGSPSILQTMDAIAEGWVQALGTLQMKSNGLSVVVVQLGSILDEMAQRAASASRREQRRVARADGSSRKQSHFHAKSPTARAIRHYLDQKPLPQRPDSVTGLIYRNLLDTRLLTSEEGDGEREACTESRPVALQSQDSSVRSTRFARLPKPTPSTQSTRSRQENEAQPLPTCTESTQPGNRDRRKRTEAPKLSIRLGLANVIRSDKSAAPSPVSPFHHSSPALQSSFAGSSHATPLTSPLPQCTPVQTTYKATETEAAASQRAGKEAQLTLIEARSRLCQQAQDMLSTQTASSAPEFPKISISAVDSDSVHSAFASSLDLDYPPISPLASPGIHTAADAISHSLTDPGAECPALPKLSHRPSHKITLFPPTPQIQPPRPAPSRRTSAPALANSVGYQTLKKLFRRGSSVGTEIRSRSRSSLYSQGRNAWAREQESANKTRLPDVFELPA